MTGLDLGFDLLVRARQPNAGADVIVGAGKPGRHPSR
jgi:hypothetical protein